MVNEEKELKKISGNMTSVLSLFRSTGLHRESRLRKAIISYS